MFLVINVLVVFILHYTIFFHQTLKNSVPCRESTAVHITASHCYHGCRFLLPFSPGARNYSSVKAHQYRKRVWARDRKETTQTRYIPLSFSLPKKDSLLSFNTFRFSPSLTPAPLPLPPAPPSFASSSSSTSASSQPYIYIYIYFYLKNYSTRISSLLWLSSSLI